MKREDFCKKIEEAIEDLCPELKSEIAERVAKVVDDIGVVPPQRLTTCGEYFKLDKNDPLYKTYYRFKIYKWEKDEK